MGSIPTLVRVFLCPCVGPFTFAAKGKTKLPIENPRSRAGINKLNPHMASILAIVPGPHWKKAISLSPLIHSGFHHIYIIYLFIHFGCKVSCEYRSVHFKLWTCLCRKTICIVPKEPKQCLECCFLPCLLLFLCLLLSFH